MKRMLINATQEEELRLALVDGQRLYDLNIELPSDERKKANIYKGKITRIEPSLEAAFVNYGAERHGFLPLKEISSEYFINQPASGGKPNIKEVLKEGQDIVVQIDKEERGNKGAALTTFVSLAGRFIVLKPNKARSGGVSRRIVGEDRDLARKSMGEVGVPSGMSVILRTAGIDRTPEELSWDLENLLAVWEAIKKVVVERPSPFLIYRESNAVIRALRDYLTSDVGEILIDDEKTYQEANEFVEQVMPQNSRKLKHYTDPVPLFTRYQIESQIESAFSHSVNLPSGGSLVIDHTEALVSIDINSARATKGEDIESTALSTNLEAAEEIARQLRLRDLGGLIVIDFIDMGPQKHQREVENRLREAVRQDRARVQIGKISRFGLLEMSRQRLRPSLGESSYLTCPRCSGIGNIRSVESLALAILRLIGEEARKERSAKVIAQLPVEVATYLLNEKRGWVQNLETKTNTKVILIANSLLETPHYNIRRVRDDQVDLPENIGTSYELAEGEEEQIIPQVAQPKKASEVAAVATVVPSTPVPKAKPKKAEQTESSGPGLFARIAALFSASGSKDEPDTEKTRGKRAGKGRQDESRERPKRKKRADGDHKTADTQKTRKPGRKRVKKTRQEDGKDGPGPDTAQNQPDDKDGGQRKKTGKRRSRGGRRRRRSQESGDGNQPRAEQPEKTADSSAAADKPAKKRRRKKAPVAAVGMDDAPVAESKANVAQPEKMDNKSAGGKPADTAVSANAETESVQRSEQAKPASQSERQPQAESDVKPEVKADAKPAISSESKAETTATAKPESKPEPKSEAKSEPKPEAKPEPKTESSPDGKDETKPAAKAEAAQKVEAAPPKAPEKPESAADKKNEAAAKPADAKASTTPMPDAPKPEPVAPKTAAEARPEVKPEPVTPAEQKPAERLLPWEPRPPTEGSNTPESNKE